jgi:hypothetical protein
MAKPKHILFWTVPAMVTLFFGLMTFMSLNEWWIVQVKQQTGGYPWGQVNENPWFYKNPEIYSEVMLIEGLAFSAILIFLTIQVIRTEKKGILYTLMFGFGLLVIMIANGAIK